MASSKNPPPPPTPKKSESEEDLPVVTLVGLHKVKGGFVVPIVTMQGDRVLDRELAEGKVLSREAAMLAFKRESAMRILAPESFRSMKS